MSKVIGIDLLCCSNFRLECGSLYLLGMKGDSKVVEVSTPENWVYRKLHYASRGNIELTSKMADSKYLSFEELLTAIKYCEEREVKVTGINLCGKDNYYAGIDVTEEVMDIAGKIKVKEIK